MKRTKTNKVLRFLCGILLIAACSKNADINPSVEDGKSILITDLAGDTGASVGDGVDGKTKRDFRTFLFRFSDKKQLWLNNAVDSAKYLKTDDWDIAFTYIYNSIVYVNSGTIAGGPGFGGPGKGSLVLAKDSEGKELAYDRITEAPEENKFENSQGFVGWDGWPQPYNFGWYFYSMNTHLAQPIKNRAFIIKTATGKYAKLELLNVYQGNPPTVTDLHWPAPYLTFRYFVQEDGSRNLNTTN
ncbi:HmuY protein [bacterium A37T11]|nr:HmuY protein [bacterium A37T11]